MILCAVTFTLLVAGSDAFFHFDLMKNFGINPSADPLPVDTSIIDAPQEVGGKALNYGPNSKPVVATGGKPAYMIYALTHSKDFTYYTRFRMTKELIDGDKFTLFALQGIEEAKLPVYFSVGVAASTEAQQGNEGDTPPDQRKLQQYIFVQQYTDYDRKSKSNNLILKKAEEFQPNKWYEIMIRIRTGSGNEAGSKRKRRAVEKAVVQVRINCNDVGSFNLQDGPFQPYPTFGYAVFGSEVKKSGSSLVAVNRLPGAMVGSQIINGAAAFDFYSPCDADFSVQEIPSEPLPSEYDDSKLKKYAKLTENVQSVSLTCKGTKETRYNGEFWTEDGGCNSYKCKNGVVTSKWICEQCTDKETKKKYRKGEKWINPSDICLEFSCELRREDIYEKKLTCVTPVCSDGFDPIKLDTECCAKCANDTCVNGRHYYAGCKRTCSGGQYFVCPEKTNGCWCPEGQVENENGECVVIGSCPCKSGSRTYKPGQTAIRSACSTCVCSNGSMVCFDRC